MHLLRQLFLSEFNEILTKCSSILCVYMFLADVDPGLMTLLQRANLIAYRLVCSVRLSVRASRNIVKGAITSKIKHAIKLKTSPARLAQLLQPSLAFCFSLQPITAYRQQLCKSCRTCFKFYCMFHFTCDHSFTQLNGSCRTCRWIIS